MDVTFDGANKLCILGDTVYEFDVWDLYSSWKVWVQQSDNAKYLQAFRSVGGDPLSADTTIAPYYFLMNDWHVRPHEEDHNLVINGNLLTEDGDFPIHNTIGVYQVNVRMVTSSAATVITVPTGSALTQAEHDQLMSIVSNVLFEAVEGSMTLQQAVRISLAILAGKTQGGGTTTLSFRDTQDTKDRVVATVDNDGNRSSVTLDGS